MSDALSHSTRFRTVNIINAFDREVLDIERGTSCQAERVIPVLDRLKNGRGFLHIFRVDNGPELLAKSLQDWGKANGVDLIQPGRPRMPLMKLQSQVSEVKSFILSLSKFGACAGDYGWLDDGLPMGNAFIRHSGEYHLALCSITRPKL